MPGKATHAFIGAALGGIVTHLMLPKDAQNRGLKILTGCGVGACLGMLPDIIEPAVHPNHRSLFHSFGTLIATGYGCKKAWDYSRREGANEEQAWASVVLVAGLSGYASHLGADALTPKSLPLVG